MDLCELMILACLQKVFYQIDSTSWTIELIAKQLIRRTRRIAKTAMNTLAQDVVRGSSLFGRQEPRA